MLTTGHCGIIRLYGLLYGPHNQQKWTFLEPANRVENLRIHNILNTDAFALKMVPIERAQWELSIGAGFVTNGTIWVELYQIKVNIPKWRFRQQSWSGLPGPYNNIIRSGGGRMMTVQYNLTFEKYLYRPPFLRSPHEDRGWQDSNVLNNAHEMHKTYYAILYLGGWDLLRADLLRWPSCDQANRSQHSCWNRYFGILILNPPISVHIVPLL